MCVNDVEVEPTEFLEKQLAHPYDNAWLGTAKEHTCYAVPANLLADADSLRVEILLTKGIRVRLRIIDVAFPT